MSAGSILRAIASSFGYRLEKTRYQRYGIDPLVDVERLAASFGWPIRCAFDVGANVGQTATAMRARFSDAEIFCFEPVPDTFRQLQTATARMRGVSAFHLALSDAAGEARIQVYDSSLLSSLEPSTPFTHGREASAVACRKETLDAFCTERGIASIGLLKIDTEGHDASVLRGASAMLSEGRIGFVLTEFNQLEDEVGGGGSLAAIGALLKRHGYAFICSYIDDVIVRDPPLVVGNALFVRARGPLADRPNCVGGLSGDGGRAR